MPSKRPRTPRRPARPARPAAPARTLSPAYAKRIANAVAKGKTRQEARGHRAPPGRTEHAARAEREREKLGISREEIARVRAWGNRRSREVGDHEFDVEGVVEAAQANGYEWFRTYRDTWTEARRTYMREQRSGEYASRGIGHLEWLASIPPVDDISWMYYH